MSCLSEFALDDFMLHQGGGAAAAAHVTACPSCRQRIDDRAAQQQQYAAVTGPPLWQEVLQRRAARRRRWRLPLLAGTLVLAGGMAMLMVVPRVDRPYVGTKGAATATVAVAVHRGETLFAADAGHPVRAGDALRFIPQAPEGFRFVALGSRDGRGTFSLFYPSQPDERSLPLPAPGEALPGSIILDDAPGPERLLVALTDQPITGQQLRAAAATSVGDSPAATGAFGPVRVQLFWITLPKESPAP
jgi:hypothetical protein